MRVVYSDVIARNTKIYQKQNMLELLQQCMNFVPQLKKLDVFRLVSWDGKELSRLKTMTLTSRAKGVRVGLCCSSTQHLQKKTSGHVGPRNSRGVET